MNLTEVLAGLYNSKLDKVLEVINKSKYVTDFEIKKDDYLIFHTGFTFQTHTGKMFELLYNFNSKQLIRQNRNGNFTVPSLLGLQYKLKDKYFNSYTNLIVISVNNTGAIGLAGIVDYKNLDREGPIKEVIIYNLKNEIVTEVHSKFIINHLEDNTEKKIHKLPLSKKLESIIFFNGRTFERYISDEEWEIDHIKDDDGRTESYEKYDGYNGWSDEDIDSAFNGDPEATWNVD